MNTTDSRGSPTSSAMSDPLSIYNIYVFDTSFDGTSAVGTTDSTIAGTTNA